MTFFLFCNKADFSRFVVLFGFQERECYVMTRVKTPLRWLLMADGNRMKKSGTMRGFGNLMGPEYRERGCFSTIIM